MSAVSCRPSRRATEEYVGHERQAAGSAGGGSALQSESVVSGCRGHLNGSRLSPIRWTTFRVTGHPHRRMPVGIETLYGELAVERGIGDLQAVVRRCGDVRT